MGEQFQNWIENIMQTRLDQELNTKMDQYCQDRFITLEHTLNSKMEQTFQNKTKSLEEAIKEKLKNEKEKPSILPNAESKQDCLLVESTLILKLEEMIDTKVQELGDKFQAQLFKELENVTSIIQLELDNIDKYTEEKVNKKFQEYLQGYQQQLDKILEEEVNKKIQDSLTTKEQFFNNILEKKVNVCLKQILESKYQQMNLKLEKQVNKTIKEILDNKIQLLTLASDNISENTETLQSTSNINPNFEPINVNSDEVQKAVNNKEHEKRLEYLNNKIKALEEELEQKKDNNKEYENNFNDLNNRIEELEGKSNSVDKRTDSRGKYANWEARHECLRKHSFVSTIDFWNTLNAMENLNGASSVQSSEIIRMFNTMTIYRVSSTKRFPIEDTYINLNDSAVADNIKDFYYCLMNLHRDRLNRSCNPWMVIKKMKYGIEMDDDEEMLLHCRVDYPHHYNYESNKELTATGFRKYDTVKFEEDNELVWSDN